MGHRGKNPLILGELCTNSNELGPSGGGAFLVLMVVVLFLVLQHDKSQQLTTYNQKAERTMVVLFLLY